VHGSVRRTESKMKLQGHIFCRIQLHPPPLRIRHPPPPKVPLPRSSHIRRPHSYVLWPEWFRHSCLRNGCRCILFLRLPYMQPASATLSHRHVPELLSAPYSFLRTHMYTFCFLPLCR